MIKKVITLFVVSATAFTFSGCVNNQNGLKRRVEEFNERTVDACRRPQTRARVPGRMQG